MYLIDCWRVTKLFEVNKTAEVEIEERGGLIWLDSIAPLESRWSFVSTLIFTRFQFKFQFQDGDFTIGKSKSQQVSVSILHSPRLISWH